MTALKSLLHEILQQWPAITAEPFKDNYFAKQFRQEYAEALMDHLDNSRGKLEINPHIGSKSWAEVAGLAVFDKQLKGQIEISFFPVYLFKADGSGIYLSLNQAHNKNKGDLDYWVARLREKVAGLSDWGEHDIELAGTQNLGKAYKRANIVARYYPADDLPSEATLQQDLSDIMQLYQLVRDFALAEIEVKKMPDENDLEIVDLAKPFILLAGISGTGKTRFVREQAGLLGKLDETYKLVSVRPDWHEPSDLLGYISRLGKEPEYVVTDVLRFVVEAYKEIVDKGVIFDNSKLIWSDKVHEEDSIRPFWLCLDEMNLAPVEQYFADYLSVIETRSWSTVDEQQNGASIYQCEPLLKPQVFDLLSGGQTGGKAKLRTALGLSQARYEKLWSYFVKNGIAVPFNLIVAGTVNMDETTHGFSRKVIDRALTLDFGMFFPNVFEDFFTPKFKPKALLYPHLSQVCESDLKDINADNDGKKSIAFLAEVNQVLKGTPFELAFRALNELLLSVVCFKPKDDYELEAVWDDFMMTKVLPRIDGDIDKLALPSDEILTQHTLLAELENRLARLLGHIWDGKRIELLLCSGSRVEPPTTNCRSKAKLAWMTKRLNSSGFTSFWP